jgi:glycosyltransferase involved in cell wall biosynthesis
MTNRPSLLSVGLAVYNGEPYLEEALESIRTQTFQDFELIISDNASTDRTGAICEEYARRNPRVRYHRNATNIGGANNENQTFRMSRSKYFRWAAHDDVCAPELFERCIAELESRPELVLCYSQVIAIDEHGQLGRLISRNHASSDLPYKRFRAMATASDFCEETYGIIRSEVLARTRLQQNYTASDRTLLSELALYGPFYEVQEPLFFKRFHPKNVYTDWRARMAWFDDGFEGAIKLPFWIQFFDYLETIRRVPLTRQEKLSCYLSMLGWLRTFGKNMAKDVAVAAFMAAHSKAWRRKRHARERIWE